MSDFRFSDFAFGLETEVWAHAYCAALPIRFPASREREAAATAADQAVFLFRKRLPGVA